MNTVLSNIFDICVKMYNYTNDYYLDLVIYKSVQSFPSTPFKQVFSTELLIAVYILLVQMMFIFK